jgi:serine/threonine protein phosphatase PrpC
MTVIVEAAGRTHIGLVRRRNEDSVYTGRSLFAVADGLGGHIAGDVASATVIDTLQHHDRQVDPADLATTLGRAVNEANAALRHRIDETPQLVGMGTTLVAMLWSQTTAVLANVGDSRAYQLRGGSQIVQLTEDHTYGNLVADAAGVPELPARLSRFLDGRVDGRSPDLTVQHLPPGDRYLLCTDGLSTVVPSASIVDIMRSMDEPGEAADRLIASAIDRGGPDNITVIVADVRA